MSKHLAAAAALVILAATPAWATSGTASGAAGGAVAGAVVGGPVGAAVGAVGGAILGTAVDPPPPPVVQYVTAQPAPTAVTVDGTIAVGQPLPETVVVQPVPDYPTYAYAVVNNQRVIVDPNTHMVVQVIR